MIKTSFEIPLADDQDLLLIPIGDVHYDTDECDRERVHRLVEWVLKQEQKGHLVRMLGIGDYLDLASPSNRKRIMDMYDTTQKSIDSIALIELQRFVEVFWPIRHCFLGLLTGHHTHVFTSSKAGKDWAGKTSDQWLAHALGCKSFSDSDRMAVLLARMNFPHGTYLDVLALHGGGGAQTPGGRVMKRIKYAEIAPTAHLVISGHDNAKMAYPRSGLDYDHGSIKRYVIGSGSFQRGYLEGQTGYAEEWGLVPADLGVVVVKINEELRNGKWRIDYHASV
jgi:hypothetical protein